MGANASKPQSGRRQAGSTGESPTNAVIIPLPQTSSSSSTRRRMTKTPDKPYRDNPTPPPNKREKSNNSSETPNSLEDNCNHYEEDEEDVYSFLPPNQDDDDVPRNGDGYIGTAAYPYRRQGLRSRIRTSMGLSDDMVICTTAFSRLSTVSRSTLMVFFCGLIFYAIFTFGVGQGSKQGVEDKRGEGETTVSKIFSGLTNVIGRDSEKDYGYEGRVFAQAQLRETRKAAQELVDLLNDYYGGETKAQNMLMRSWQVEWKLDLSQYLVNEEHDSDETGIWDDDDDFGEIEDDDAERSEPAGLDDVKEVAGSDKTKEEAKNGEIDENKNSLKNNKNNNKKDVNKNENTAITDKNGNSENKNQDNDNNKKNDISKSNQDKEDDKKVDENNNANDDKNKNKNNDKKDNKNNNEKKNKKENNNNDDKKNNKNDSKENNKNDNKNGKNRKLGKTFVKRAKTIHNHPDNLTPEQIQQHKHYSKQRTTKLITTMAQALLNPLQDDFKIGTIGSSVAAGHDNCHYDSYESQLQRTLSSIFQSAGMNLIVQNAGEGGGCGDTHENQVFCITHNVSPDVDIIHYSWTYFEHGGAEKARESLIRWGQQMPKRPMVHHLVARGKANTCEGDSKENAMLDNTYAAYGYNAFCIQTGLYFGGHDYDKEQEEGINRFGWQQVGDGYHNTTRYGELEEDEERRNGLGTVYRNWHPGPLGFQIASDAFAYVYSMGVLMALELIEKDMDAGLDPRDRWFVKSTDDRGLLSTDGEYDETELMNFIETENKSLLHDASSKQRLLEPKLSLPPQTVKDMPKPLFCNPLYCSIPHPPSCINYEKPTYGVPGPTVQTQNEWKIWKQNNNWAYEVGKKDIALFKRWNDEEWYQKCTHLDACGGIAASDSSKGELVFELPASKMTTGLIIVCGCCGKKVGEDMFLKNENLEIKLNGKVLNKSKMDVYPNAKCARLVKAFKDFDEDSDISKEDELLLSFNLKTNTNEVKISHLIAL
mmetsp:Transcript_17726/g.35564  ORF Transcript_17726/g.35564 Transcript_17726/m.35564 type:complete len:989 (+) Transcript_17726:49-3015(+)